METLKKRIKNVSYATVITAKECSKKRDNEDIILQEGFVHMDNDELGVIDKGVFKPLEFTEEAYNVLDTTRRSFSEPDTKTRRVSLINRILCEDMGKLSLEDYEDILTYVREKVKGK